MCSVGLKSALDTTRLGHFSHLKYRLLEKVAPLELAVDHSSLFLPWACDTFLAHGIYAATMVASKLSITLR